MTALISIDKVPEHLKPMYRNIAKNGNNPELIDTEEEKSAFRVIVNHAIYTDKTISIDIAEEMGFKRSELYIEEPEPEESTWKKLGNLALGIFRLCITNGV